MKDEIEWLDSWCKKQNLKLILEGECGFGRECVGVSSGDENETYPDYEWHDEDYNRVDKNGDIWTPDDAYHKHPCVAVLGRGQNAVHQLYEWCVWFEENDFMFKTYDVECKDPIELMLGRNKHYVMEKNSFKKKLNKVLENDLVN